MKITQLLLIQHTLKEALTFVRLVQKGGDVVQPAYLGLGRRIQNAQSIIATDMMVQTFPGNTLPYVKGASYLFIVDDEPKFVLDDWAAADSTKDWYNTPGYRRMIKIVPVLNNPTEDQLLAGL